MCTDVSMCTYRKWVKYCACWAGDPRNGKLSGVMGLLSPVPRWSIKYTLKWVSAGLTHALASVARGPSKPGPPGETWWDCGEIVHMTTHVLLLCGLSQK